jgi:diguanylate cyclase (GGDEF)-like protein
LRLADALLGPPGPQRWRAAQSLLALAAYAALSGLVLGLGSAVGGVIDMARAWPLALGALAVAAAFAGVIRSGLNLRLQAWLGCEPSLTLPQAIVGVLCTLGTYAVAGPARGATLGLLVLVVVFAMFRLRPRESVGLALFALAAAGLAMQALAASDPLRFPARVERVHLALTACVLAGVTLLSLRLARLRERLTRQREELARALARIGELATRDELTGLPNRRAILALLATETARQARLPVPLTLALIDLDHFKRINDTHGHAAGDAALRGFARCIEAELRGGDVMARWGGEEFLLMLPGTDAAQAVLAVERLRRHLRAAAFDEIAPGLTLTFSAGVSACLGQGDIEPAIERADRAMYRAKAAGRDRTEPA